jgi:Uma2 family endonuclease
MSVQLARRLFTVDDYYRMAEAGILNEDDRVELIEGEIIEMTPIGSPHASIVRRFEALFSQLVTNERAMISAQNPVRLSDFSEPQPDIALLRWRSDYYASVHPGPADVLLLVEVADTSIEYDREVKLGLYAQAGISEVWIVDIGSHAVEVYREPSVHGYESVVTAGPGQQVSPAAFPELQISIEQILG